jgi:hypothetical protein
MNDVLLAQGGGEDMRPKGNAGELERRRQRAIALLEKGHAPVYVARTLGVVPSENLVRSVVIEDFGDLGQPDT